MTDDAPTEGSLLSPRKIALQTVGFVVGVALLIWCIKTAFGGDGDEWRRIAHANPWLVLGLVGCTLVSMFVNGTLFWLVAQPMQRLGFRDMQWLNLVTAVLNYAPIRAGLIARVAYHLRVDRLSLLEIGAYLAAIAYTLALTVGSCIVATLIRPGIDGWWWALLLGQLALGGGLTWALMGQPLVARYGRGMDEMLRQPLCLWGAIGLRLVDIGAFVGRMFCAVAILELDLSGPETVLLGIAAITLSLNPIGRTGFREIAVAFVASQLVSPDLSNTELDSAMATLALVESAGEAMVAIPLGAICLLWYRRRWKNAKPSP
ncbi:MAG: hypothetical protein HKO59_04730 [Phycisphaerales bacterium]|nr:hypothetical protein [Phycisphaerae bacterium]NNF44073.1 hypothetical protein [Phycisphaerales bacterium]NNM25282.1 hypothetical protein [Phycisphaerales bacterium]